MITLKIKHDNFASTCFICDGELDAVDMTIKDGMVEDCYACDKCNILITFISKEGVPYHEMNSCVIEVESQIP